MILKRIWLTPPFAIARVGMSPTPMDAYSWGKNDLSPRGTGKTTIEPAETLVLSETGEVSSKIPETVIFKDDMGFRPVCPYFELKGEWEDDDGEIYKGSITIDILNKAGIDIATVKWSIEIGNLKAYHYTLADQEKIYAKQELAGNNNSKVELFGFANDIDGEESLFISESKMPMGFVQLSKPNNEFPELRLRFFAPKGKIYGPVDIEERMEKNTRDENYQIPEEQLIVNPNSKWATYRADTSRTNPGGLLAMYSYNSNGQTINSSVGLIDDVGDGTIKCSIGELVATCRITVAPPDFAPDRRPFVSLADGLKDRVSRLDVISEEYLSNHELTSLEIRDLFERILETLELMNLDFQNYRAIRTNREIAQGIGLPDDVGIRKLFPVIEDSNLPNRSLPLTEIGRQQHRRFVALEVIEDKLRENPELLDKWVRKPMTGDKFYDTKMPPLMRGSDRYPMHITQRQYNLLKAWVKSLRTNETPGT